MKMPVYIVMPYDHTTCSYFPGDLKTSLTLWGANTIKQVEEKKEDDPDVEWVIFEDSLDMNYEC